MAFVAPNQGFGAPVFNPTQSPYASSQPINPRLLLLHQLLRSPDGNTYNHPNFGFHHFPGQFIPAPGAPTPDMPMPATPPINVGFGHIPPPQPQPINPSPIPVMGGDPSGPPTPDEAATVQAMQDQVNATPHPAVHASLAAVQAAHDRAVQLAEHITRQRSGRIWAHPAYLKRPTPGVLA